MDATQIVDQLLADLAYVEEAKRFAFAKARLQTISDSATRQLAEACFLVGWQSVPTTQTKLDVVVLIHGIRTDAVWQNIVADELHKHPNIKVIITGYEFLDVVKFLVPIFWRNGPIILMLEQLRGIAAENQNANVSVLAHSFGTYIITKILEKNSDVILHRLLLCGAVVPAKFKWSMLPRFPRMGVLNDVGTKDFLPALAKMVTWGYGSSGTFGFKNHKVTDRFHALGHSDFFDKAHIRKYWVPYFVKGEIIKSTWDTRRPKQPWRVQFMNFFPFKTTLSIIVIGVIYWWFFR